MGVHTSNSATDAVVKDFKYWMGVIPYKVVAVNPNLEELQKIGIEYLQSEPEYISKQDFGRGEVVNTILDFWVQSVKTPDTPEDLDLLTNIRFRINHAEWVGQSGKKQFINKYGRTAWADDIPALDANKYFINEGVRPSHRGEEELHKFIFSWLNMTYDTKDKKYDDCLLDINKLVKGDFSEVKAIVTGSPEYTVKVLTGVQVSEKEGKVRYYQTLYNQMFLKHNQTSTNRMEEHVNKDDYTAFSTDNRPIHYSFNIQEFDKSVKPDVDPKPQEETPESVF